MPEKGLPKFRSRLLGKGVHLKTGFALGAPPGNVTIVGLRPGDQFVAVYELRPPTAASGNAIVAEHSANANVVQNDTLDIPADTSGNQVMAFWWTPA